MTEPNRPGFVRQPDGTEAPTGSYVLLARRAHEHKPMVREARRAALDLLARVEGEFRDLGIEAKVVEDGDELRVAYPASWLRKPGYRAGVSVTVTNHSAWTVEWVRVDDYGERSSAGEPTRLEVRYEHERKAFSYKDEEGQWQPDAGEGLMKRMLERVPAPQK